MLEKSALPDNVCLSFTVSMKDTTLHSLEISMLNLDISNSKITTCVGILPNASVHVKFQIFAPLPD